MHWHVKQTSMKCAFLGLVLVLAVLVIGCGESSGPVYLALGDSLAVGEGASDEGEKGYVPLFYRFLKDELGNDLALRNIGVRAETSLSLVTEGQLGRALEVLRRNWDDDDANDVAIITLNIGGNDLRALIKEGGACEAPASLESPGCADAVPKVIEAYQTGLAAILRTLRVAAGPDVQIYVVTLMNSYSGTGGPLDEAGDAVVALVNGQVEAVAQSPAIDAIVVDVVTASTGRGSELSHVEDPDSDFHANDAGHQLMADALMEAYGR